MAPTVACNARGEMLAIGSPGADRITTALLQVLHLHLVQGRPLHDAIGAARLHVQYDADEIELAHEPGIALPADTPRTRPFAERSMYFGGVSAACARAGALEAAADPRRAGGTRVVDA